jgi:hypothetical protein
MMNVRKILDTTQQLDAMELIGRQAQASRGRWQLGILGAKSGVGQAYEATASAGPFDSSGKTVAERLIE